MMVIVTHLHRADHGELEARVSLGGGSVLVTRRFGSWGTMPDEDGSWRPLRPSFAIALQERARVFERRERQR